MGWTAVRVCESTKALLEKFREQLLRGEEQMGGGRLNPDSRDRVGMDQVIRILLDREHRHNERKKKAAKTARQKAAAAAAAAKEPGLV